MRTSHVIFAAMLVTGCSLITNLSDLGSRDLDGSSSNDATTSGDAITADGPLSNCPIIDGGAAYSPGLVDCFGFGTCAAGQWCCSTFGCIAPPPSTQASACLMQDGSALPCDEAADCDGGEQCCYGHQSTANRLGTRCNFECSLDPDDVVACKSDCDCTANLTHCEKTPCFGVEIQTCGGVCPK